MEITQLYLKKKIEKRMKKNVISEDVRKIKGLNVLIYF